MDELRYRALIAFQGLLLTNKESLNGWHFCGDWDEMLIHSSSPEYECCNCGYKEWLKENKND